MLATAAALALPAHAQLPPAIDADELKAAYLHKFAGFVEWPAAAFAAPQAPFAVGVLLAERLHAALTHIVRGRVVQGRAFALQAYDSAGAVAAAGELHLLFVGRDTARAAAAALFAGLRRRPALTVTDLADGLDLGAMLAFIEAGRRIRFEAAPATAEACGLKLSSRLLAVADRVQSGGAPEAADPAAQARLVPAQPPPDGRPA